MKIRKICLVAGLATVALAAAAVLPASAQTPRAAANKASDVGVTADTIRIAVVADVDNPILPGIFKSAVDGVNGAVKTINKSGGIAGRKLQVDFIDSKLNPNEARNAIIKACQQDFAMVGTAALFLTDVQDLVSCQDIKGNASGLPDFGAIVAGTAEACAPTSFPVLASGTICDTLTQNPQTYQGNMGAAKFLLKKFGNLHGAFVVGNDTKPGYNAGYVLAETVAAAGIKQDQNVALSARAPQSVYTPVVSKMKQDGSNFAYGGAQASGNVQWRSEAQLQGLDPKTVWLCSSACYVKAFTDAGSAVDGNYVALPFLPFEDAKFSQPMKNFVKAVGADKVESYSLYGYSATLAFQQAVQAAVKAGGNNNVTRTAVVDGAKTLTAFNAGGLLGTANLGQKKLSPCYVLMQIENGKWSRVNPTKPGTFSCDPKNYKLLKLNLQ